MHATGLNIKRAERRFTDLRASSLCSREYCVRIYVSAVLTAKVRSSNRVDFTGCVRVNDNSTVWWR